MSLFSFNVLYHISDLWDNCGGEKKTGLCDLVFTSLKRKIKRLKNSPSLQINFFYLH